MSTEYGTQGAVSPSTRVSHLLVGLTLIWLFHHLAPGTKKDAGTAIWPSKFSPGVQEGLILLGFCLQPPVLHLAATVLQKLAPRISSGAP